MMHKCESIKLRDVPTFVRAKTKLLHLPNSKSLDVVFKNISFSVNTGSFFNKSTKPVLKGVSGRFCSGELTAIIGPSGAGKSSLLNILTGFQRKGMTGSISCFTRTKGGSEGPLERKDCCYIMQDDNLTPLLTVKEVMLVAADLKLDHSTTKKSKLMLVENVLENVGLCHSENSPCMRLSGGERKRLSVALELIDNPPVMFMDEPTTGLDSQSTIQIVTLLKSLARGGRTIVCTIHQPSASVFEMFDHVYIVAGGYCVYQGSSANMVPFLQSVGLPCPQYHNPADFILDVICGEFGDHTEALMDAATNSIWRRPLPPESQGDTDSHGDVQKSPVTRLNPPSELYRFRVLLRRTLKLMIRDWTVIYLKLVLHILTGVTIGLIFQNTGADGSMSVTNIGYFMGSVTYISYTSLMPAILKFPSELHVIKKEQFNNWYKLRTYYVAFQVTNLPIQMLFTTQFVIISYLLTSQIVESERFFRFLLVNILQTVISECLGLGLGTTINPVNGIFFGAVGICLMILLAGFLVLRQDMPVFMYYLSYASYMRYTLEGMVLSIYSYGRENLLCTETYCHFRSPLVVLDTLGMRDGDYTHDVANLITIALLSIVAAYLSLRRRMTS